LKAVYIGAGSDTTPTALISMVYYLYRDRGVLERLRVEFVSSGLPVQPTFREAQKLHFMQAVIKEFIRVQLASDSLCGERC
jgi:cytochrome P450